MFVTRHDVWYNVGILVMTGQAHPHWLTLLGLGPLQPQQAWRGEGRRLPNHYYLSTDYSKIRPSQDGDFRARVLP
jgi:hypothetical protein